MSAHAFAIELTPLTRQTRVAYLHDVLLDAGQELVVGDHVDLRDEGGAPWTGRVVAIEDARLGRKYRLSIQPAAQPTIEPTT